MAAFFSNWRTYRAVIETDSMEHRRIYGRVHEHLARRDGPFTVLDLGCGDAAGTGPALRGTQVTAYTGVDCAAPALDFAQQTLAQSPFEVQLRIADIDDCLSEAGEDFDVIVMSFALHHFPTDDKRRLLRVALQRLRPGGELLLIDVVRREGESRDQYLDRYAEFVSGWPVGAPMRADILEHVYAADFPEEFHSQPKWADEIGYSSVTEFYSGAAETQAGWVLAR